MQKILKKAALAVVLSLMVSGMAPATEIALAATPKTFTYAEQISGKSVAELQMSIGEKQDLKFIGVPDYQNYSLRWVSTNESVAVVDRMGVITAMGAGTTSIRLIIGDETVYTSEGVIVHVDSGEKILLGTSSTSTFTFKNMTLNETMDLNFYGLKNWNPSRFTCKWTSTNPEVATVTSYGVVTPKKAGIAVIQLSIINLYTGESFDAVPVAVYVTATATATPTPTPRPYVTPTPTPTPWPYVTPTPTPTPWPFATPTPTPNPLATVTPIPTDVYVPYTVTVDSDHSLFVKFTKTVSFDAGDIEVYQILTVGNEIIEVKLNVEEATLNAAKTEMNIVMEDVFTSGNRYFIKIGTVDTGKTFAVNIGAPNRVEIIYKCLGQERMAYAYDDEVGIDVPVTFDYKLYYGNIDVTESYGNNGYISYELVSPKNSDNVDLDDDQLYFYAPKTTAVVSATYTYYDDNGREKTIKNTTSIQAQKMGEYTITHVANWTIIDGSSSNKDKIDWENPVHEVVAGKEDYKLVALLADTYGFFYSTDERGVDTANNIYSADDGETLFAQKGYSYSFRSSDSDKFLVLDEGEIYPYEAVSRAAAYITLYNVDEWSGGERNVGAFQFKVLAESKLTTVKIEDSSVNLVTDAVNNEERFCQADIPVSLLDQYGNKWDGDAYLMISSSTSQVDNALDAGYGSPASIEYDEDEEQYYLHIDAKNILALTSKTTVSFTVTEEETNKKDSISVSLKKPTTSGGKIDVTSWGVGVKDNSIVFGDGDLSELNAQAEIEIYQVSKNNQNVGLFSNGDDDENGTECDIIVQKTKTQSFSSSKCEEGQIYVLIQGPDNKVVEMADDENDLGVWQDPGTGHVYVNVTALSNGSLSCLKEGRYNVTVTKINSISGTTVKKASKTTYFTVTDNTKDVTLKSIKGSETSLSADSMDDVKEIIGEMFTFELGGVTWTSMDPEEMITYVDYKKLSGNYIRIISIEFAVPADGKTPGGITYKKTVSKINKTIETEVDD